MAFVSALAVACDYFPKSESLVSGSADEVVSVGQEFNIRYVMFVPVESPNADVLC